MNLPFPQPVTVVSLPTSLQYKAPVAYNANLTIEHQVHTSWLLRAAYVGTHSSGLVVNEQADPSVYIPGALFRRPRGGFIPATDRSPMAVSQAAMPSTTPCS